MEVNQGKIEDLTNGLVALEIVKNCFKEEREVLNRAFPDCTRLMFIDKFMISDGVHHGHMCWLGVDETDLPKITAREILGMPPKERLVFPTFESMEIDELSLLKTLVGSLEYKLCIEINKFNTARWVRGTLEVALKNICNRKLEKLYLVEKIKKFDDSYEPSESNKVDNKYAFREIGVTKDSHYYKCLLIP